MRFIIPADLFGNSRQGKDAAVIERVGMTQAGIQVAREKFRPGTAEAIIEKQDKCHASGKTARTERKTENVVVSLRHDIAN